MTIKQIVNDDQVQRMLDQAIARSLKDLDHDVTVGYTAEYAVYVHEDLNARHASGKQAKYLEEPAKRLAPQIAQIIVAAYKRTKKLLPGLLLAGLALQRASQKVVPVDTGNLKNSAFTKKTKR